jgi:hypothetical protein
MKRRELLSSIVATGFAMPALAAQGEHNHKPMSGPLATATVSFGYWPQVPADGRVNGGNRFKEPLAAGPAGQANGHAVLPYEAKIKAGGTVNFIVAGYHLIAVYAPGIALEDIDASKFADPLPIPPGPTNQGPPLIDDETGRVYFGLDPRKAPLAANIMPPPVAPPPYSQDRVEVVHFPNPGRHLVICAVLPHFLERMHGWVNVVP